MASWRSWFNRLIDAPVFGQPPRGVDGSVWFEELCAQGRNQEALAYIKTALQAAEREHGPEHASVAHPPY